MKARRRRSFLRCFGGKHSTVEQELDEGSATSSYSSSSASSRDTKAILFDGDPSSRMEERTKKKTARRLLTKILRSAIFIKSLEKGRSAAAGEENGDPSSSRPSKNCTASPIDTCNPTALISPSSSTSSASSSSFSISSPAPPSPQPLTDVAPRRREGCRRFRLPTSLVLSLLLGLVIMLLPCGRLFAVLGSSTCLCVMPRGTPCESYPHGWWRSGEVVGREATAGEWLGNYRNKT